MAEVSAFVYGWIAGIVAVVIWILYGIGTLLRMMRSVNDIFAHIPGLAHLAERKSAGQEAGQRGGSGGSTAADQGLEGLTGSTKRMTPITAAATCMMSWYGPDGSTGPPVECRLALDNNVVTVYQLLHLTDSNTGSVGASVAASGGGGGRSGSTGKGAAGRSGSTRSTSKDARRDANAFRTAAGVTMVEHRKGRVSVLRTTVMEVRHFNVAKKTTDGAATTAGASSEKVGGGGGGGGAAKGRAQFSSSSAQRGGVETSGRWEETLPGSEASSGGGTEALAAANTPPANADVDAFFTGRVLIWRTMDGSPLLSSTSTPDAEAGRGGRRRSASAASPLAASPMRGGARAPPSTSPSIHSGDSHTAHSSSAEEDVTEDGEADSAHEQRRSPHHGGGGGHHRHRRSMMGDMENWSCVVLKFERSRESERWLSLLSGLKEARAWHDFAKSLPNPDTVNTFLSRFFFQNMRLNGLSDALIKQIRKKLQELPAKKFPRDLGGDLILDDFLIGTQIPWISDVSEPTVSANGEVGFDFNLLYKGGEGGFTLFFRLALTYRGLRIPHVVFSVKLLELEATVHLSIGPPPSKKFWIGGHKPPILRLEVHQGCASGKGVLHRVLTALPDLSGIMTNLIKLYLFSDMVLPYMDDFPLPSVVKSPKGSQADLRVRTFDWQRAAKISGAPERRGSTTSARSDGSDASGNKTERRGSSGSGVSASPHSPGGRSSAVAASSFASARGPPGPSGSRADSQQASPRRDSLNSAATAAKARLPPLRDGGGGGGGGGGGDRVSLSAGSFATRSSLEVASPVLLASPTAAPAPPSSRAAARSSEERSAPHLANTTSFAASGGGASMASEPASNTALDDSLYGDTTTVHSESEGVLSSTGALKTGGSRTLRNLKSLLKLKGKDMARESVSRSKKS
ncbi:putative integral membrane protein conserved region (DUF2404) [Novymonas esmeraldas]|uniref:Integral membrane protein conserved region (DUF2404) n=1 Tax=Novymonas esmeraldas TaxID=1808958 RepID=A0AAW0EXI9_9TRYP